MAQKEEYFHGIQIWYDEEDPDPVIIGLVGKWDIMKDSYSYYEDENDNYVNFETKEEAEKFIKDNAGKGEDGKDFTLRLDTTKKYLIARWGDVKQSFQELKQRAVERYITTNSARYQEQIKEY